MWLACLYEGVTLLLILGWLPAPGDAYRCVASVDSEHRVPSPRSALYGKRSRTGLLTPRLGITRAPGRRRPVSSMPGCRCRAGRETSFCNTPKPVTPEELALNVLPGPIPFDECTQLPSCRRTDVRSPKRPSIRASRSRIMKFSSPTSRSRGNHRLEARRPGGSDCRSAGDAVRDVTRPAESSGSTRCAVGIIFRELAGTRPDRQQAPQPLTWGFVRHQGLEPRTR
jgi:hypothetical protein